MSAILPNGLDEVEAHATELKLSAELRMLICHESAQDMR